MGRSRYKIYNPQQPHFLTCTVINWIPIFTRPDTVNILLNSFHHLQKYHQLKLYGFVVLENHIHWLAQSENLPKEIARFKSYTAKMIIHYLERQKQYKLLKQMHFYKKKHKTDRQYQFWEEGSHSEEIQNKAMLLQKLEYIHYNPVKRGYVDNAEDWRYSSARSYLGREGLLEVFTTW
jgi:REP element-mobilizing transposase RayT